jgi:hypothetical protein
MIVLIVFGLLGLLCCGGCLGTCYFAGRAAGPVALMGGVLPHVQTNPQVIEKLGSPVQPAGMPTSPNADLSQGATSAVDFEISGPKGKGKVHAEVTMTPNGFDPKVITVTGPDGSVINVSGEVDKTDITIPEIDMDEVETN